MDPSQFIRVSASQFSTYRDCPRKWWFEKVVKLPRPEHPSAQLGTRIHADLETWFTTGEAPQMRESLALLEHLPARSEELRAEDELDFLLFPQVPARVKGFIDLRHLAKLRVWDYKSTANINRYSKTEQDLVTDPQTLIYGLGTRMDYLDAFGEIPDEVTMSWCYVQTKTAATKTPPTKIVTLKQTKTMMEDGLAGLEPLSGEMRSLGSGLLVLDHQGDVPYNKEGCYKYGGCPFRDFCTAFQNEKRQAKPMEAPVVDFDLIAKATAALNSAMKPPSAAAPPPAPPPPPNVTPEPAEMPPMDVTEAVATSAVLSPQAAPDVSPTDPAQPAEVEVLPKRRGPGRPKKSETDAAAPTRAAAPASDAPAEVELCREAATALKVACVTLVQSDRTGLAIRALDLARNIEGLIEILSEEG